MGGDGPVQVVYRTLQKTVKLSKMHLPQTMHGETEGFLNVDPLNIFAC